MNNFQKFLDVRKEYAIRMPIWIAEYERTGDMRHDPYFMEWEFSPIENHVWGDIRSLGLPFFPQVPVLNYFIDFACPFLKIGIECDGKVWHNQDKDKARDARLASEGWMIFRIEGHKCFKVIEPWNDFGDGYDEDEELIRKYFLDTSEGVVSAIKRRYFNDFDEVRYKFFVDSTLSNHRSTPETFPIKLAIKTSDMPVLFSSEIDKYVAHIVKYSEAA